MAEYAYILNNQISEIVDIHPSLYANWAMAGNPKAQVYRPVIRNAVPTYDERTQAVDPVVTILPTAVLFGWIVRPKTSDELRKTWTSYEFLMRFTDVERKRIWTRAKTDDDIADFLMLAQSANEVLSDDPTTIAGMSILVGKNIISSTRKDEILNA